MGRTCEDSEPDKYFLILSVEPEDLDKKLLKIAQEFIPVETDFGRIGDLLWIMMGVKYYPC